MEDHTYAGVAVLYLLAGLWLQPSSVHGHMKVLETYEVSVGHLFILTCSPGRTNVTWKRGGDANSSLPAGVEVKDGDLWFLPVVEAHGGTYVCCNSWERAYEVRVSREPCPAAVESRWTARQVVPCKLALPKGTVASAPVEWLKECVPVNLTGGHVEVTSRGGLRILRASETNSGLYTCLLHLSLGGHNYTAARSLNLTTGPMTVLSKPRLVYPSEEREEIVEIGSRMELRCEAFLGIRDDETHMYWTINGEHLTSPNLNYSWSDVEEDGKSTFSLVISLVGSELLDVPISCHLINSAGQGQGTFRLRAADHRGLYVCVLVPLTLCLVGLALVLWKVCKVELVLAYRGLRKRLVSQQALDGKLYDAYVSHLDSSQGGSSSSEAETFALKVLPEVMEERHGFRLFIRGRDDCPGEALHDVITEALSKSRRLVLLLSGRSNTEASPLHPSQPALAYEHSVGLYSALTQGGLRVILVEIDGPVDYTALPESLRFIHRTQGALRWRGASHRNHASTKWSGNGSFWKSLRYHMPPSSSPEAGSPQTKDMVIGFKKRSPIPVLNFFKGGDVELADSNK